SQVAMRVFELNNARDWDGLTEILADDYCSDDRRRVVSAGTRHGRDAEIENLRTAADIGFTSATGSVIAIRGERVALVRIRSLGPDQRPETFHMEMLCVVEINADGQGAAAVVFDPDDLDAAFAELDARYLSGEAAGHAQTWSVIAGALDA